MIQKPQSGELRTVLANKLGISERQVYNRAQELANRASIKISDAIWVLAAQNQINLTKYLPPEVVDRVRYLLPQIPAPPRGAMPSGEKAERKKKTAPKEFVVAKDFKGSDPILPIQVFEEAREMAAIYPLLYLLENSIREYLRRIVDARLGKEWWTTTAQSRIKDKINDRMSDENKHAWHQRRGDHPIDYLDFSELSLIVKNNEALFVPDFLPSVQWFEQFVLEAYKSRCVVCHMNPLEQDNILDVRLKIKKWQKLVEAKKDALPAVVVPNP